MNCNNQDLNSTTTKEMGIINEENETTDSRESVTFATNQGT